MLAVYRLLKAVHYLAPVIFLYAIDFCFLSLSAAYVRLGALVLEVKAIFGIFKIVGVSKTINSWLKVRTVYTRV